MPPKKNANPKPVMGPPHKLIVRIKHLCSLLSSLSISLLENPFNFPYRFYLDPDAIEDRGYLGGLSHALEVSFKTHLLHGAPIQFRQRGSSLDPLPLLLKTAVKQMTSNEREVFRNSWLERLINAAVAAGAKVNRKAPKMPTAVDTPATKKSKASVITINDSDTEMDTPSTTSPSPGLSKSSTSMSLLPAPSTSSTTRLVPIGNPKQTTLQFPRGTKEDIHRYWSNVAESSKERRKVDGERVEQCAEEQKQHTRELTKEQ